VKKKDVARGSGRHKSILEKKKKKNKGMTYEINLNLFIYSYSFFLNINNIIFVGISRATKNKPGSSKSPLEANGFNIFSVPMFMTNTPTQIDIVSKGPT
jgi:hypothetical protein